MLIVNMLSVDMLSFMMLTVIKLNVIKLSTIMLSFIKLDCQLAKDHYALVLFFFLSCCSSVVRPNVVILNVAAPMFTMNEGRCVSQTTLEPPR